MAGPQAVAAVRRPLLLLVACVLRLAAPGGGAGRHAAAAGAVDCGAAVSWGPWRETAVSFSGRWGVGLTVSRVRFAVGGNERKDGHEH